MSHYWGLWINSISAKIYNYGYDNGSLSNKERDKRRQPFQPKCDCLVLNIKFFGLTKKCITTSCTTRESYWSDIWNSFTSLQLERGSGDDWMEKWLILLKMFHIQKINSPESWVNTPCMDKKINTRAVEQKLFKKQWLIS